MSEKSINDAAVRSLILRIVDDAMRAKDRHVTINFFEAGPVVTIYPIIDEEEE